MPTFSRVATLLVALALLTTACGDATVRAPASAPTASRAPTVVAPVPTDAPTAIPQPTALPRLADGVHIAGVDVGGLEPAAARRKLEAALAPLLRPLEVQAGPARLTLKPEDIGLEIPFDDLIAEAQAAGPDGRVGIQVRYDQARLRAALERLAGQVARPPTITVISDTDTISRSFAVVGGERLDIDAAVAQIVERLRAVGGARRVTLALARGADATARPTPEQLQRQIEAMAAEWQGVVGVYVYDLASDQVVAALNENTVFSGASVMKVPILLQSYITIPEFTPRQEQWLEKMIVESDNLAANQMLAASANGSGTEDALQGALDMTEMLQSLGLEHTYQYMPYEASEYLIKVRKFQIKRGPLREGSAPYTEPDPVLRTTPAEISRVFLLIYQCSRGQGLLLEKFANALTAGRCQEMLDRLEQNGDHSRMVAGLPPGTRVAHKSGWIEDMQADVGIVHSPGGDFLLAVYLYRKIDPRKTYLTDEVAAPVIASFARLVYSYYNPKRLEMRN